MQNIGIALAAAGYAATYVAWAHESDDKLAHSHEYHMCCYEQSCGYDCDIMAMTFARNEGRPALLRR